MAGFVGTWRPGAAVGRSRATDAVRPRHRAVVRAEGGDGATGKVVEIFRDGKLKFGRVSEEYDGGIMADVVDVKNAEGPVKVPDGEIISVWSDEPSLASEEELIKLIESGKNIIRSAPSRALNLTRWSREMLTAGKTHSFTSGDLAEKLFPSLVTGPSRSGARAAAAMLVGSDTVRFKRGKPRKGFRALPPSVAASRARSDFCDFARTVAESRKEEKGKVRWNREHLKLLQALEVCAVSQAPPASDAKAVLKELGREPDHEGARALLIELGYWSKTPAPDQGRRYRLRGDAGDSTKAKSEPVEGADFAFPESALKEAKRALEEHSELRRKYAAGAISLWRDQRLIEHNVYCVDEFRTKFYDDAVSVVSLDDGITRVQVHVADVDAVVRGGGSMDRVAFDRGESMYLPRRPLHMIPPAAMEAASFSPILYGFALTISLDINHETGEVVNSEVFRSVLKPIIRVTYDQFDQVMSKESSAYGDDAMYPKQWMTDLEALGQATAALIKNREARDGGDRRAADHRRIAGVLLSRGKKGSPEVRDFKKSPAHRAIDELLTAAGEQLRQFAKKRKCPLPERKGAELFARRCGTAPMRRYVDLVIQRQIKTVLINHQLPAGRRRMIDLCAALEARHNEVRGIIGQQRQTTLFYALAEQVAHQRAAGAEKSILNGKVIRVDKGKKAVVALLGTGLTTAASVAPEIQDLSHGKHVKVAVTDVAPEDQQLRAEVVEVVAG